MKYNILNHEFDCCAWYFNVFMYFLERIFDPYLWWMSTI